MGEIIMRRPSGEEVTLEKVVEIVKNYILEAPDEKYEFTVGTDSQNHFYTKIVRVIAIHRVGKGGLFFYNSEYVQNISSLKQKISIETSKSLELANGLLDRLEYSLMDDNISIDDLDVVFQIHCDIGNQGKTKELIKEITSWVEASGYTCLIKPNSYAASGIANKYSK